MLKEPTVVLSLHGLEGDLRKDDTTQKTTQKTREVIIDALKNSKYLCTFTTLK